MLTKVIVGVSLLLTGGFFSFEDLTSFFAELPFVVGEVSAIFVFKKEKQSRQWKISFKPDPVSKLSKPSQKNIKIYHFPLYFRNQEVAMVADHKQLDVNMDSKLSSNTPRGI